MKPRLVSAMRWLGGRRAILPLTTRLLCSRLVRESSTFFALETFRVPRMRIYHLRESGLRVAIRHRRNDVATLSEVFYLRYYDAREGVAAAIGEPREILDLGANIGLFGAYALGRWPDARIVAYEPDPANAAMHERTIAANEQFAGQWNLLHAAAAPEDGSARFAADLEVESHLLGPGDATLQSTTVPTRDVVAQMPSFDLVKMDIEGGEWEILFDARFSESPPRVIVLEYHPRLCPEPDPRLAAERALTRAGLTIESVWHRNDGHGMLWAWQH